VKILQKVLGGLLFGLTLYSTVFSAVILEFSEWGDAFVACLFRDNSNFRTTTTNDKLGKIQMVHHWRGGL